MIKLADYRSVEIEILGETYKYKVDEPEEVINKILEAIKVDVEDYSKSFGKSKVNHILLLMLLNEKLNTIKAKNQIKEIIKKFDSLVEPPKNEDQTNETVFYWE
ncbi:MAG: hypothetical protein PWP28_1226 [Oceanotoga sp.]|nr:hypothetical protein [Oceanotoga sp.]